MSMEMIDDQAVLLAEQFTNGNRAIVHAALRALDPIFAAAMAARIGHLLTANGSAHADIFVSWLVTKAFDDAQRYA